MSDTTEHLAPVSYLPWVKPEPAADPSASTTEPSSTQRDGFDEAEATRPGRSSPRRADVRNARRRGAPSARSAVLDDDADETGADETGAERDSRIDRLVVSRLRRSALSTAEVRSVLAEHGLDEVEIEEWIERYERLGYLDDARLAEQLVHANGARRGRGSGAILH